ncbi:hypothetical protein BH582_12190 [Vibrio sp. 10N.222.47.A9]|uniref:hypothetical protein n=1 Tax=Vibrio sp. 10N.222.47.A9 TaxID=1903178 RepID=UPI0009767FF9|nr:hypothetical protein [Vibrio sp. 10N.222.47.A9]OMO31701.1 hypothetical protein BH582_12190 [Vibrio sp. 10N.222.47.A9]
MKDIIAHRGFWLKTSEQNTKVAFERALSNGFGIETDLRDRNQSLVISHDVPSVDAMPFDTFLGICKHSRKDQKIALNIKADGLQPLLEEFDIKNEHFYFDMSVPDMIGFLKKSMNVFSRYSNIEEEPSLYGDCKGIWLDNFNDNKLNLVILDKFLKDNKNVVLVSPELHKKDESGYWSDLREFINSNPQWSDNIGLCTDYPSKARDYFNEK